RSLRKRANKMNSLYIPIKFIFLFIFISLILFIFGNFWLFVLWLIIFFFFVVAFRKIPIDYKDYLGVEKKIIYSPIHGRVKKIDETNCELVLSMPFWGPFGVFFPARAEVINTDEKLIKKGIFTKLDFKANFKLAENQE